MKILKIVLVGIAFTFELTHGETMDANRIRQFMQQMDDSLARGNIYHINYAVCDKKTDAFYAHKREMIKLFEEAAAKQASETPPSQQGAAFADSQATYQQVIRQWENELKQAKELTIFSDYSLDGTGFYLKQFMTFVTVDGKAEVRPADITVSDGKIMGSFYPDQLQAVIEPATERPQVANADWAETVYSFMNHRLSTFMENYPSLSMTEQGNSLIITGEKVLGPKEKGQTVLTIDKATLVPQNVVFLYYNESGALQQKITKTWQYQNIAGLLIPKSVTEQEFKAILNEGPALEKERIVTINHFDPVPMNAKQEFASLLNSNYSVFDEITGSHYLSGNPGKTLDDLSK